MENRINWEQIEQIRTEEVIKCMDSTIREFYENFQTETNRMSEQRTWMFNRHQNMNQEFIATNNHTKDTIIREKKEAESELLSKKQKAIAEINMFKVKAKNQRDAEYKKIETTKSNKRAQVELQINKLEQIRKKLDDEKRSLEYGFNGGIFFKTWDAQTSVPIKFISKEEAVNYNFEILDEAIKKFNMLTGLFQKKKARELCEEICSYIKWAYTQIEADKQKLRVEGEKECSEIEKTKTQYDDCLRVNINSAEEQIRKCEAEYREGLEWVNTEYERKCEELERYIVKEGNTINNIIKLEKEQFDTESAQNMQKMYTDFYENFMDLFPCDKLYNFLHYYSKVLRPDYEKYTCRTEIPEQIVIGNICVDASNYLQNDSIREFLTTNYKDIFKFEKLRMPYAINLAEQSNMVFEYSTVQDKLVIRHIQSIVNSILLSMPAMKVNFALIDPLKSTNTFAPFNKFIEVNKSSAKLLTGGIATSEVAIVEKLKIVNDHMENIISTCLKSNEMSIQEYNVLAGPNAEPYQIISVMDFPANFTIEAAKYLEKIVETGPRCGVYTIIMTSKEHLNEADPKIQAIYRNIKNRLYQYDLNGDTYNTLSLNTGNLTYSLGLFDMLTDQQIDTIVPIYKKGISDAGRIIVDYDYVQIPREEWFKASTSESISIPIGLVGVNNIQSIELGADGVSHHALIAGQSGAGKTSLFHGMIMNALMKYSPEELEIYLIDFKNGVEFKLYANYKLPNFKVIAVESEREFGHSVLSHLDKELKRRSDLFKKYAGCKNLAKYRELSGNVLPRILFIIDEYHELFNKNNQDHITATSAELLQRLLSQGRAFGIHVVLATQSISNVGGLNSSIYELIAVRIGLKCSEPDAKLILGESADAVNMIDSSDSGKAIYNPNCGDKSVNSVFRVAYLESERQVQLLNEIADVYAESNAVVNTRVMLSNVEDDFNNIYMRYIDGDTVSLEKAQLYIGESLKVSEKFAIGFKSQRAANLLMIGKNKKQGRDANLLALLSLLMYQEKNKNKNIKIYVYDYAKPEDVDEDFFVRLNNQLASENYVYIEGQESLKVFPKMYEEVISQKNEETYFIFMGLKLARDFRNDNIYASEYYNMLAELIQKNSSLNCHAIIWDDSIKIFNNNYQGLMAYFDDRIAFNMSDEDGELFVDETNCSQLSSMNAIYFSAGNNNKKFRTYIVPSEDSLYEESWIYRFGEKYNENHKGDCEV